MFSSALRRVRFPVATSTFKQVGAVRAFSSCGCPSSHGSSHKRSLHQKINEYLDKEEALINGTHPDLEDVFKTNAEYRAKRLQESPEYFERTKTRQDPKYLYIGCSDARVNPNQFLGLENDEVFVTRNIGNQVAPGDLNVMSVMEFSLGVLKIPHVIVCGHYDCGAIKAALSTSKDGGYGFLEIWLRHIRDVARIHYDDLQKYDDPDEKHKRMVELNVMEQCFNVLKAPIVQKLRVESFQNPDHKYTLPRVHGLVYDVKDGSLKKVNLDFKKEIVKHREVYDLYQVSNPAADKLTAEFWRSGSGQVKS